MKRFSLFETNNNNHGRRNDTLKTHTWSPLTWQVQKKMNMKRRRKTKDK